MMRIPWLLVGLLSLALLPACASDGAGAVDDVTASPLKLVEDAEQADDKEDVDGRCRHVWRAIGFHPYTNTRTGVPMTDLCTVQRCDKCGATRHECARRRR